MTETTIQEGDEVVLKGFPNSKKMTVEKISSNEVTCLWIEKSYPRRETFHISSLQKFLKKDLFTIVWPKSVFEWIIVIDILVIIVLFVIALIDDDYRKNFQVIVSSITPFGVIISLYALIKQ